MRAVVCREPGGPEVLEVREVPDPTPGPGEVVIDIAAAGGQPRRPPAAPRRLPPAARGERRPRPGVLRHDQRRRRRGRTLAGGRRGVRAAHQLAGTPTRSRCPPARCSPCRPASACSRPRPCPRWPARSGRTSSCSPPFSLARPCSCTAARAASARWRSSLRTRSARRLRRTVGSEEKASVLPGARRRPRRQLPRAGLRRGGPALDDSGADVILDHIGREVPRAATSSLLATEGRLVVIGLMGGRKGELDLGALLTQARRA